MNIAGIDKTSFIDYPGHLSCVLFVPGCNYNCFYCHNRRLITKDYTLLDLKVVDMFLRKRANFLDGVVISGGEPTLQPGLIEYIEKIKRYGYKIKLDTNGSSPDVITNLIKLGLCNYYAIDYKAPKDLYSTYIGNNIDVNKVLDTINILLKYGANFEVRTTVFRQLGLNELITMAKELPILPKYVLNKYNTPEVFESKNENLIKTAISENLYTEKDINEFRLNIKQYQPNIVINSI